MKKILIIDDDRLFLDLLTNYVRERYPDLEIISCDEPLQGLAQIDKDLFTLIISSKWINGTEALGHTKK